MSVKNIEELKSRFGYSSNLADDVWGGICDQVLSAIRAWDAQDQTAKDWYLNPGEDTSAAEKKAMIMGVLLADARLDVDAMAIIEIIGVEEFVSMSKSEVASFLMDIRQIEVAHIQEEENKKLISEISPEGSKLISNTPDATSSPPEVIDATPAEESEPSGTSGGDIPGRGADGEQIFNFWNEALQVEVKRDSSGEVTEARAYEWRSDSKEEKTEIEELLVETLNIELSRSQQDVELEEDTRFESDSVGVEISSVYSSEYATSVEALVGALNSISHLIISIHDGESLQDQEEELQGVNSVIFDQLVELSSGEVGTSDSSKFKEDEGDGSSGTEIDDLRLRSVGKNGVRKPKQDSSLKVGFLSEKKKKSESGEKISICSYYPVFSKVLSSVMEVVKAEDNGEFLDINIDTTLFDNLISAIISEVESINERSVTGTFGGDGRLVLTKEDGRNDGLKRADDLFLAVKIWDEEVKDIQRLFEGAATQGADKISDLYLSKRIVIDGEPILEESLRMVMNLVYPDLSSLNIGGLRPDEQNDEFKNKYYEIMSREIRKKFKTFFNKIYVHKFGNHFLTHGMYNSIKQAYVRLMVRNSLDNRRVYGWQGIACPMCDKTVKLRKYTVNMSGTDERREHADYGAYSIKEFSSFRKNKAGEGILATREYMLLDGADSADGGRVIRYEFSEKPDEPMNWDEISALIGSNNQATREEGVRRRSEALSKRGFSSITSSVNVSSRRFGCPFSCPQGGCDSGEVSGAALSASSTCGLSFDTSFLKNKEKADSMRPEHLQYSATNSSGLSFLEELSLAEGRGDIGEEKRKEFEEHFEKMRSGGWKFSRTFFACPCHIEVPKSKLSTNTPDEFHKFRYLAIPHSGPASDAARSVRGYAPPTSPDGLGFEAEEGRSAYLVCGATVSLSAFNRDPDHKQSLSSMIARISGAPGADSSVVAELIDLMVSNGVDIEDLMPALAAMGDKIASVGQSSTARVVKIAELMSVAIDLGNFFRGKSRMDILGDLGLVCKYGHKFTIDQSLSFGAHHSGYDLTNDRSGVNWTTIGRARLLTTRGDDNLNAVVRAGILTKVEKENKDDWKPYDKWIGENSKSKKDFEFLIQGKDSESFYALGSPGAGKAAESGIFGRRRRYVWGGHSDDLESYSPLLSRIGDAVFLDVNRRDIQDSGISKEGTALGATEADKMAAREYDRIESTLGKMSGELDVEADTNVSHIGGVLSSVLKNIISWVEVGTGPGLKNILGTEEKVCCEEEDVEKILNTATSIVEGLLTEADIDDSEGRVSAASKSVRINIKDIISREFEGNDLFFLQVSSGYSRVSVEKLISEAISSTITRLEPSVGSISSVHSRVTGMAAISDIIDILVPAPESDDRVLTEESAFSGVGVMKRRSILAQRQSEYVGRLVMLAIAIRASDNISRIFRHYMSEDLNPFGYIGYPIGLDLSSSEKIMSLNFDDIEKIVTSYHGVLTSLGDVERGRLISLMNAGDSNDEAREERVRWMESLADIGGELKRAITGARTASLSHEYLNRAREFFKERLSDPGAESETSGGFRSSMRGSIPIMDISLHRDDKYIQNDYNYYGSFSPTFSASIVTFGEDLRFKSREIGASAGFHRRGIMHLLSTSSEVSPSIAQYGIEVPFADNKDDAYVLAKGEIIGEKVVHPPHGILNVDLTGRLPLKIRENGWSVFLIHSVSKNSNDKKAMYNLKNKLVHLSAVHHPFSEINKEDDTMTNIHLGFDSKDGAHFGRISYSTGLSRHPLPRRDMFDGPVGLAIPVVGHRSAKPSGKGTFTVTPSGRTTVPPQDKLSVQPAYPTRVPIVEVRAPINISSGTNTMIKDVSTFLQRSPAESSAIMEKIDGLYSKYQRERVQLVSARASHPEPAAGVSVFSADIVSEAISSGKMEGLIGDLRAYYVGEISSLHKDYRSLPYRTKTTVTGGHKIGGLSSEPTSEGAVSADAFESHIAGSAYYIPMMDWITVYHIISSEQYGPEFGGHFLWDASAAEDYKAEVKDNVRNMLIKTYGLESLVSSLNAEAERIISKKGSNKDFRVEVEDILDGKSLVGKCKDAGILGDLLDYDDEHTKEVGTSSLFWRTLPVTDESGAKVEAEDLWRYESSLFEGKGRANYSSIISAKMKRTHTALREWHYYSGGLYPIRSDEGRDVYISEDGNEPVVLSPGAFIRIMSDIGAKEIDALEEKRSYDSSDILSLSDLDRVSIPSIKIMYSDPKEGADLVKYPFGAKISSGSILKFAEKLSEHLHGSARDAIRATIAEANALHGAAAESDGSPPPGAQPAAPEKARVIRRRKRKEAMKSFNKIAQRRSNLERIILRARAEDLFGLLK